MSIVNTIRAAVTVLTASLLLAAAASTASAGKFSFSNQNIRVTFTSLEFSGSATVRCQVTLEGSFHTRTIAKVARSLIGAITRATIREESCTNGSARALAAPWHATYESFTGTLPNITSVGILISRFLFNMRVPGLCDGDYGTESDNITVAASREAGGNITGVQPVAGRNIMHLLRRNSGLACPAEGSFAGTGSVMLLSTTTPIRATLI